MKRTHLSMALALVLLVTVLGCGGASDNDQSDAKKAQDSGNASNDASSEVCAAVNALNASLDVLEDSDSFEEYGTRKDVVRQDFQKLRTASGGKYAAECDAFESSLVEFEQSLKSVDDGGLISGLLGLAKEAAGLATAGDRLDDAIDCPNT